MILAAILLVIPLLVYGIDSNLTGTTASRRKGVWQPWQTSYSNTPDTLQNSNYYTTVEPIQHDASIDQSSRPSVYIPKFTLMASNHQSSTLEETKNKAMLSAQKFIPRWNPNALTLTDYNLIPHKYFELDHSNTFTYLRPKLTESAWDSIVEFKRTHHRKEAQIRLENDRNGLLMERKLTDFIHSIATQIDESLELMQMFLVPSEFEFAPLSVIEFEFTSEELVQYRFLVRLKAMATDDKYKPSSEKALQIYQSATLNSDLAQLSLDIFKITAVWDQNKLGKHLSEKLALLVFIYKQSVKFWSSLDTTNRRLAIERFCKSNPTSKSIVRLLRTGSQLLQVLKEIKAFHPMSNILCTMTRVKNKMHVLSLPKEQVNISESKQVPTQVHDKPLTIESSSNQIINAVSNRSKSRRKKAGPLSLYEKALKELKIVDRTPKASVKNQLIKETLSTIQASVELYLVSKRDSMELSESLRESLMLQLDPSIISYLNPDELTVYLGLFQATTEHVDDFVDVDGSYFVFDTIKSVSAGDNLESLSIKALGLYDWTFNQHRMSLDAVGKTLARKINISLAEHFFWKIAAQDDDRILELKRFLNVQANAETVKEDIEAGRKLVYFCKKVQSTKVLELIETKMAALVEFEIDYIVSLSFK